MKTQSISTQNFCAKQEYLRPEAMRNMHALLKEMNAKTVCEEHADSFKATVLHELEIKKDNENVRFYDRRKLVRKNSTKEAQSLGTSIIEMDDAFIKVSNLDGKILEYNKPWYKNFNKLVQKAEEYLKTAVNNFENRKVVSHGYSLVPAKNIDGFGRLLTKVR